LNSNFPVKPYHLLESIDVPADIRALETAKLPQLAAELRAFLIESVSQTGGHLSAGLGTIELTIALHYVYNTPVDRLIWDVGHQSYAHKILTGRRQQMATLRQLDGLAGFPKRSESPYDTFGVGHSSTSISAALGMAIAAARQQLTHKVVAVIGDGAMTAGMAFEALNHGGSLESDLLVILNDNDMSISPNVGGMSNYLAKILSGRFYATIKEGSKKVLGKMPTVWELARRAEEHVKGMVVPGTLFEELGFNYIGPIDGHDLNALVPTLQNLRQLNGPQFLHVVTKKGKGYKPAEENPCQFHGVSSFDPKTGTPKATADKNANTSPTYTEVFGQWACDMAAQYDDVMVITPAMREGSGLVSYSQQYPSRYFDVGIAEQHAVTLAAGMACEGMRPVVAIYSTFLQRAYDQLLHDVAIQNLPVVFAVDRAGLVGPDGPTHAGNFDLSFARCIPNLVIMAPADENECRQMLYTAYASSSPCLVRYPRGKGPGVAVQQLMRQLPLGKAELRRQGKFVAILAFGSMLQAAEEVAEKLDATLVNMRFIKPLDENLVISLARRHGLIVTIEENAVSGGAGSAVNECLAQHALTVPILNLGIPDRFIEQGSREQCLSRCGLDSESIAKAIQNHPQMHTCQDQRSTLVF